MLQDDLLSILPEGKEQNTDKELYSIVMRFLNKEWLTPTFQRGFAWNDDQIKGWIKSIREKKAIGVIVTYQLRGGGPIFVADGFQRLTATSYFLSDPQRYGYEFGAEQARKDCQQFEITVQHRIYINHKEAMESFQRLNMGTALTPKEFYAGELALSQIANSLTVKIPEIISKYEASLVTLKRRRNRKVEHALIRDSYALFLQYISGTDRLHLWDVSSSSVSETKGQPVEGGLIKHIETQHWTGGDCERAIQNFEEYIASQVALIRELLEESGGKGLPINVTVFRWILHLSIWRKNSGRHVQVYQALVKQYFTYCIQRYGRIQSRTELPNKELVTLHMNNLTHLKTLCVAFGSHLYEGKTRQKKPVSAGYHNSHILPFSEHGEGDTFPEPATLNMARGAKPV